MTVFKLAYSKLKDESWQHDYRHLDRETDSDWSNDPAVPTRRPIAEYCITYRGLGDVPSLNRSRFIDP